MKTPFRHLEEITVVATHRACTIAKALDHPLTTAEDLLLGIIDALECEVYYDTFCLLLGLNDKKLQKELKAIAAIEREYFHSHNKTYLQPDHYDFIEPLQSHILPYKKKENTDLDILMLLDWSIDLLSPKFQKLLSNKSTSYQTIRDNIKNLAQLPMIKKMGFMRFVDELDLMIGNLDLDLSEIEMMKIQNLPYKDFTELVNAMESEIMEKPEGENISVDTSEQKPKKKEEKKLTIEYFGTDLTKEAKDGYLDPIIGREKEIDQVIYTLLRKSKNNPLLIGEAGVGKTAIVEGLVQRINMGKVPEKLIGKKVFLLDMGTLVAGTKYRGEFESRMKSILEEATDPTNNIILFIDELHTIIGAGGQDQNDAAQMLKPLLSRGKIKLIGATTFDEYQKYIEKDAALKRRFQEVVVEEPSIETTKKIITGLKQIYEDFHGIALSEEAIDAAISLSKRYILNKQLPDKALDIIDEASARKSTMQQKLDNDETYKKQEKKIEKIQKQIENAIENQDYFSAAELKSQEEELKKELNKIRSNKNIPMNLRSVITAEDIGKVLADKTGIPTNIVNEDEITKLKRLDTELKDQITGQNEAVDNVVKTLIRSRLSVIRKDKPIGSFLFLGPSGVGKTYLAKLIAKTYFGDEGAMIRFDMSEFMEKFSVSKLIGSPAGYVGYEEGGGMTEAVKRKPYAVLLLDEIEKAAPDVLNILLQILDEGQLKDSKGRRVDFKNTIIIMTSNIGTEEFSKKKASI
ncbi:MAG: ATP-dependent Clp protease ATP-binding subunit [bacterium]|nr:ATP-dependent Clp protease ATP-binding subunit [bacterium]